MPAFLIGPQRGAAAARREPGDARYVWARALARLQDQTSPPSFDTYLRDTRALLYDAGASVLRVGAANPFHVPWLEGRFSSAVHTAVAEVLGSPVRVEFVVEASSEATGDSSVDAADRQRERPRP